MDYGFIMTRHVNSEQANKYWNQNVKLLRTYYPTQQIIIIDDNSNSKFLKSDHDYNNLIVIQSEYHGRGELLPYVYYIKHKWFKNAVIIHDSVFIHKRIAFERINTPVIPLWHAPYDQEQLPNSLRIASALTNNNKLEYVLQPNVVQMLSITKQSIDICFGCQCFINLEFLLALQAKYNITNLVHVIHNRTDRCTLERIMGAIFFLECTQLKNHHSIFGNIFKFPNAWKYTWDKYMQDLSKGYVPNALVKVWTGR